MNWIEMGDRDRETLTARGWKIDDRGWLKTEKGSGVTESEIREVVREALSNVAPEVDFGTVDPTKDLRDQIDLDSVDFLNFVIGLHKALGIDIPDADVPKLASLNSCVNYLLSRTGKSS